MKKQLPFLSLLIALLAIRLSAVFAAPVQPVRTLVVPATNGTAPTLDGVVDDCYSDEQSTSLIYDAQAEHWTGPSDFTAVFHLAYDLEFLYMIAIITDDIEESYDSGYFEPWMFDNVEVFLQLDTNTTYPIYDDYTEQFRICRNFDEIESDGEDGLWAFYMESTGGTGWIIEVAIPWAAAATEGILPEDFMDDPAVEVIGFDFAGADSDDTDGDPTVGNRDYQTAWDEDEGDGMEDQAWQNVTVFGYLSVGYCRAVDIYPENNIIVYPNPTDNILTFDIEGEQTIEIYSINGTKVFTQQTTGIVDISSLKRGFYVARIGNNSVRFVKE